jgi:hypothetical protein
MLSTRTTSDKKSPIARNEDLKAIQRVLNNRRSAQASRERKRRYLSELEMNRSHLLNEAQALRQRIKQLEADKVALAQQIAQLRDERTKVIGLSNGDEEFCDDKMMPSTTMMMKEPAYQMGFFRSVSHPSVFELPSLSGPTNYTLPMPTPISSLSKTATISHSILPSPSTASLNNRSQLATLTPRCSWPETCSFWNSYRPSRRHHRYYHRRYHCSKKNY